MFPNVWQLVISRFKGAANAWDRFWFTPKDSFSLSVIRLLTGGMLFYSILVWGLNLDAFFGRNGFNGEGLISGLQASRGFAPSFWWYVPDDWMLPVHVLCCVLVLAFFLGAYTRVTSILAWCIAISYSHRALLANFGLDQILCLLTMYLMLAPCGDHLSVDAWLRTRQRRDGSPKPSPMTSVATRLIQIHFCVIYFFAGLSKLQGETWWNGTAIWNAIANYEYQSLDLTFLARWPFIIDVITPATVLWELSFAALVWNRTLRPFVLFLGVGMHLGIGAFLGMWTFGLIMTFGYVSFVEPLFLRNVMQSVRRRVRPTVATPTGPPEVRDILGPEAELVGASATQFRTDNSTSNSKSLEPQTSAHERPRSTSVDLVLVKSKRRHVSAVVEYLERHGRRVYWVDGLVQAQQLARCMNAIVIVLDKRNAEEIAHCVERIKRTNPHTKFVIRRGRRNSDHLPLPDGDCEFIPENCSHRQIRLACELLGANFESGKDGGEKMSDESREQSDLRQIGASGRGEHELARNIKRVSALLLVIALASGCNSSDLDPQVAMDRAASLNDLGRHDEALVALAEEALEAVPRVRYLKGIAYEGVGDLERAIESYTACLELDPNYTDALNNRAVVYGKIDKIELAIADLEEAIERNPNDGIAWANLGLAHHEMGNFEVAIKHYNEAEKRTVQPQIAFQRGNSYLGLEKFELAVQDYEASLKLDSRFAPAHLNKAIALFRLGQLSLARESLAKAERFDSDMSVTAIVRNMRSTILNDDLQSIAEEEAKRWLSAKGWEISQNSLEDTFCFRATRLPVAGDERAGSEHIPSPPDDFIAIVLVKHSDQGVLCESSVLKSVWDAKDQTVSLFVFDSDKLEAAVTDDPQASELPTGIASIDYDWRPKPSELEPVQYRIQTPTQFAQQQSSEGS